MVAEANRLPAELTRTGARIAWVAGVRPLPTYVGLFTAAGLQVRGPSRTTPRSGRMIDQIEARLELVRLTARAQDAALGLHFNRGGQVLAATRAAVADGVIGYGLLVAEKP